MPFPFSDLSQSKMRPAVVLADAGRGDFILCQVTSNSYADPLAIEIGQADVVGGSLHRLSYARPGKLFTAHLSLIAKELGVLTPAVRERVVDGAIRILRGNKP